jgi:hypothetical protein
MQGEPAAGGGGGLDDLSKMFGDIDPKMFEDMAGMGPQFDEIMEMMANMSPEEMEAQMKGAMEMLQSGDMMQNMMGQQDEILKALEETGAVDAEELARFKTDPEYFEQKMKESFSQMNELFSDPDVLKEATKGMAGISEMLQNPGMMDEMMESLLKDFDDDEKIEEVRQMFLTNPDLGNPALAEMFQSEEMKEILQDPVKWRESVKDGQGLLNQGAAGGAGVGEL